MCVRRITLRLIDADACPKLFDKEYKETMELIRQGEEHLDSLAEGFSEAAKVIRQMPTIDPESLLPDLVDKIASYLEREENWARLKHRCWLIGDRSDELRELLHEALKDGE